MACQRRLRSLRTAEVPLKKGAPGASHTHTKYGCATQGPITRAASIASPLPHYGEPGGRQLRASASCACLKATRGRRYPRGHTNNHGSESELGANEPAADPAPSSAGASSAKSASRAHAAARRGRIIAPARRRLPTERWHHASASGRRASLDRMVQSKSRPTASGNEYCSSGSTGTTSGMPRRSRSGTTPLRLRLGGQSQTGCSASGRTATAGNGSASRSV